MGARRGTLALVAVDGAVPVSPGAVLLEEMLAGWRRQQQARRLTARLTGERERVVRQFAEFTGCWPWQWTAAQAVAARDRPPRPVRARVAGPAGR